MRIASFLPSATESLYELGAGSQIVGVTHECNFPSQAMKKPRIIKPTFNPKSMTAREVDNKIVELMHSGKDIYVVDGKTLKRLNPDLIIAQGICEVCSPFTKEIDRALTILDNRPDVLVLDPHNFEDILLNIMDLAKKINRVSQGRKLVSSLQKRIEIVCRMNLMEDTKPTVLCIEWIDPLFTAGHWVPQMVELAGGKNGLSSSGEPSRRMEMEEAVDLNPDIIVLMPCGFGINRTLNDLRALSNDEKWNSLRAVNNKSIYVVNANAYFSKPGPRIIVGLEILAKILHPEASKHIRVPIGSFKKIH